MAIRSTTSSNQPPPPFYAQHTTGPHRNVHRAADAAKPNSFGTREIGGPWAVATPVILGRRLSPELATGTGPNTQITDSVTQAIIRLDMFPPGL